MRRKFRSYIKAKAFVKSLKLKNHYQWKDYTRSKNFPSDLPTQPNRTYKKHFISLGDFLGTGKTPYKNKYKDFIKLKKFAQKLKIKTIQEWKNKSKNFPISIPKAPWSVFKNNGWKSTKDFLNNEKRFFSYNEAKKYVKKLNIKSSNEWRKYFKKNAVPYYLSSRPDSYYEKKKQWKGWGDFLGTGRKQRSRKN